MKMREIVIVIVVAVIFYILGERKPGMLKIVGL